MSDPMNNPSTPDLPGNSAAVLEACLHELRRRRLLQELVSGDLAGSALEASIFSVARKELKQKRLRRRFGAVAALAMAASVVLTTGWLFWNAAMREQAGPSWAIHGEGNTFGNHNGPKEHSPSGFVRLPTGQTGVFTRLESACDVARVSDPDTRGMAGFVSIENVPWVDRAAPEVKSDRLLASDEEVLEIGRGKLALLGGGGSGTRPGRIHAF